MPITDHGVQMEHAQEVREAVAQEFGLHAGAPEFPENRTQDVENEIALAG